ncbi:hypothetical protein IWQ56_001196 [Coemansia nantahalensis]|nr:hypothetical protein IWQ57_006832 [Coemansia nantahalensis]KAJ2772888.1 hypothetical protein IWQ56_001196 [Coemansia nantahalensis]
MSKCVSGSDETVFGDAAPTLSGDDSTQRRHHPASQVRPLSLSATVVGLSVADAGDTAASPGYAPSPCNTLLPSSCPPSARYQLHERFSAELKWDTIEELDGEGGAVFYNGLKRLSLPEAGFVIQGRPRVVNI